ncbi:MAG: WG repeat-containing protein [Pyrinomonadaceae bacterium]
MAAAAWWQLPKYQAYIPPRVFDISNADPEPLFNITINGRAGCMNRAARIVIEPEYDDIRCSSDRLVPFEENGQWGYLDQSGAIILEPQFSLANHGYSNNFSNGLAVVCQNSKCGYIDESGKYVIKPIFDWAGHFYEGLAIARVGSASFLGWQYKAPITVMIDTKGEIVFGEPNIRPSDNFSDGLAEAEVNGVTAFINTDGVASFSVQEKGVGKFSEGLAVFGTRDLYRFGYIDKNGEVVIQQQFKQAGEFSEGLATVMFENGKYGYIDRSGNTVVGPEFDVAGTFHEGRAVVRIGSKEGYIDITGKMVIPLLFGSAERFKDGLARVSFDDENPPYETKKYGYIDLEGKFVLNPIN